MKRPFSTRALTIMAAFAGLLYCSWPLGYVLNPIANRGLASNLEATSQPYNWLFSSLDVISGLLICFVTYQLYRSISSRKRSWLVLVALTGLGLFGLLTAIDTTLPIDCIAPAERCPPVWNDPNFIIHGIASIGSSNGLTLSIVALWWILIRRKSTPPVIGFAMHGIMIIWFGFGIGTGALILLDLSSAFAQHVFIVVCSLWVSAMPYLIQAASKPRQPGRLASKA